MRFFWPHWVQARMRDMGDLRWLMDWMPWKGF
jgi:hypothetical protein